VPADVAIVTPVYKPTLSPPERLSLRRCQKILAGYPKILVCPTGMDTSAYREILDEVEIRVFDPACFASVRDYSRMLRLPAFYERFLDFEWMLVYQPDCYVFEDRLGELCSNAYDYIGAPWLNFDWLATRRKWARFVVGLPHVMNKVGNGGLSLRRTRVLYETARRFRWLGERLDMHEDLYFCSLLARIYRNLRVASFDEALRFAFELEPRRCYELAGRRLPFGCHAFERYDFAFWREHFDREDLAAAGFTSS
jgi:hypothetical protein